MGEEHIGDGKADKNIQMVASLIVRVQCEGYYRHLQMVIMDTVQIVCQVIRYFILWTILEINYTPDQYI